MTKRTIDFDKYREEKEDSIELVAFGEKLEAPSSPALAVVEDIVELDEKDEDEIPPEKLIDMLKVLLGEDSYKSLRDNGAELGDLEWIFNQIFSIYEEEGILGSPGGEEGDGSGNPSKSSSTGG